MVLDTYDPPKKGSLGNPVSVTPLPGNSIHHFNGDVRFPGFGSGLWDGIEVAGSSFMLGKLASTRIPPVAPRRRTVIHGPPSASGGSHTSARSVEREEPETPLIDSIRREGRARHAAFCLFRPTHSGYSCTRGRFRVVPIQRARSWRESENANRNFGEEIEANGVVKGTHAVKRQ